MMYLKASSGNIFLMQVTLCGLRSKRSRTKADFQIQKGTEVTKAE